MSFSGEKKMVKKSVSTWLVDPIFSKKRMTLKGSKVQKVKDYLLLLIHHLLFIIKADFILTKIPHLSD
jgi:hypothetical protein